MYFCDLLKKTKKMRYLTLRATVLDSCVGFYAEQVLGLLNVLHGPNEPTVMSTAEVLERALGVASYSQTSAEFNRVFECLTQVKKHANCFALVGAVTAAAIALQSQNNRARRENLPQVTAAVDDLIRAKFKPADYRAISSQRLTTTEIQIALGTRLSTKILGSALKRLGFERRGFRIKGRTIYAFSVAPV